MDTHLKKLFEKNADWAEKIKLEDPGFFAKLSELQAPEYLWIGCADSRVPANEIVGLLPGELFVHRNVANVIVLSDLNCLSVIQYAVEVLQVKYIIVCGHYGCGGVKAAMETNSLGLIDHWLHPIKSAYIKNKDRIDKLASERDKVDAMCEINVLEQLMNLSHFTIVQEAWKKEQPLSLHGWIYNINDGILHDLGVSMTGLNQVPAEYRLV